MKNISEIKDEIRSLQNTDRKDLKPSHHQKINKRLKFLRMCVMYLETSPSDSFNKGEIKKLENRVSLLQDGYDPDRFSIQVNKSKLDKKLRAEYEKEVGIPKLREQIRALRFILK